MDIEETQIRQVVLRQMGRCSVCHRHFENDDLKVMARNANVWMLAVRCHDCNARLFVAALLGDEDGENARMALREIVKRTRPEQESEFGIVEVDVSAPVTEDDVADMKVFLDSFDGNFRDLFGTHSG